MKKTLIILSILIILSSTINITNSLYFEVTHKRSKCFIEELYTTNMAMVKYYIKGMPGADEEHQDLLQNFHIIMTTEEDDDGKKKILIDKRLTQSKDKLTVTAPKDGQYRICITFQPGFWANKYPLFMGVKILSDNMDEPDLTHAIKQGEVDEVHDKVGKILNKANNYINHQDHMMHIEDKDAKKIMKTQNLYFYATILQILIVVVLGIYQIMNFKNFLDKNNNSNIL